MYYLIMLLLLLSPLSAIAGPLDNLAAALETGNPEMVRPYLAPEVAYRRLDLVGKQKMQQRMVRSDGILPFVRPVTEVQTDTRGSNASYLRVINNNSDDVDFVQELEVWVSMAGSQVVAITEITLEGSYPGAPAGCPETGIKRHEEATLYGDQGELIRVFRSMRDTDAWAFSENKSCRPKPGLFFEDTEVVIQDGMHQLTQYRHVGRVDRTVGGGEEGIMFYNQFRGGSLTSGGARAYRFDGRLFLFLSRSWLRAKGVGEMEVTHRITAFDVASDLKPVWGFDFGQEGPNGYLWSLSSPGADGMIVATIDEGNDTCPHGTSMRFERAGRGFKTVKNGAPSACFLASWGSESGILNRGEAAFENLAKRSVKQTKKEKSKKPDISATSHDDDDDDADEDDEGEEPKGIDLVH